MEKIRYYKKTLNETYKMISIANRNVVEKIGNVHVIRCAFSDHVFIFDGDVVVYYARYFKNGKLDFVEVIDERFDEYVD